MNPELKLKDILIPETVGIFPLAPIWWVILIVIVVVTILIIWYRGSKYRNAKIMTEKLFKQTKNKIRDLNNYDDKHLALQKSNQLLKVLIVNMHTEKQAYNLHQKDWINHLENLATPFSFSKQSKRLLTDAIYQKPEDFDLVIFINELESWLEQCRKNYV